MRFWLPTVDVDSHAAFRGRFTLDAGKHVNLQTAGTGYYEILIDTNEDGPGPARFTPGHPEFISTPTYLYAGEHLVTIRATHPGIDTRIQPNMPPFLDIRLMNGDEEIALKWKGIAIPGYRAQTRRINPELGWIEWRDTREFNNDWTSTKFDDSKWKDVKVQEAKPPVAAKIAGVYPTPHALEHFDSGQLAEAFGYELDDAPARFFLRDLSCEDLPAQGRWYRYDLERVRLGKLWIGLDVPAGAIVEIAYAEALRSGRVAPYITLSAGPSCNMDHFVARGGPQIFSSLEPRGGRFVEVHVIAPPDKVKLVSCAYMERTYHKVSIGSFICNDDLLTRIWLMGRETYRACSEDAIIDNPTRERGQWTGDSYIGMETAGVAFDDQRLARRALVQAAENTRADGLVSGMTPGNSALSSYAAQWVTACVRYHQLTGDKTLLDELFEPAVHNLHAFEAFLKPEGLIDGLGWAFIDWGYQRAPGPIDLALNVHYLLALRAMQKWCAIHGWKDDAQPYAEKEKHISDVLIARLKKETFASLGYHANALFLRAKLFPEDQIPACIAFIKNHWRTRFPYNPNAPRLSDPGFSSTQIVTPYFAHHIFPALLDHNETDFVLDMYRKCWGWMLSTGATTCLEVFDTRWSHCHQWAACPTWQLSRYVLGLHPRHDLGVNHFDLNVKPGSLQSANGLLPIQNGSVRVDWSRDNKRIKLNLTPTAPIILHRGDEIIQVSAPKALEIAI